MTLTNNTQGRCFLLPYRHALLPGGTVSVADALYENDDCMAAAVNRLSLAGFAAVSGYSGAFPRKVEWDPDGRQRRGAAVKGATITDSIAALKV